MKIVFAVGLSLLAAAAATCALAATHSAPTQHPVQLLTLPGVHPHAGFDDMSFAPALDRILMPGGDSGRLYLIDPNGNTVSPEAQVSAAAKPHGWHHAGTSSATFAHGYIIASDHTTQSLALIDASRGKVVAHIKLASGSDYVRYVAPVKQVWVTEPEAKQIQTFAVDFTGKRPIFKSAGAISIPGGPESLVIDAQAGRAYTNLWHSHTLAINLRSHKVVARWPNSCHGSRGLALAPKQRLLFVGCSEGKAVALNLAKHGAVTASAKTGAGVDIIAWNPSLQHLYVPGARSATLTILKLTDGDHLKPLATVATAKGGHCVATDGKHKAYVCDPRHGRVLVVTDH